MIVDAPAIQSYCLTKAFTLSQTGYCGNSLLGANFSMEGEKEGQMKSILDRSFKYTPSSKTDLRKTFAKVRREQCLNTKPTVVQKPIRANIFRFETR